MIARVGKKNKDRGGGSGFKYRKRSAEDVKKRADQTGGNFDSPVKRGFDMWRPKAGENVIRILPPTWEDYEHYGFDVFMHRFIGSDSSNYVCLNKMKGKHCPACDEAKSLKDEGEEDEAKQMAFQKRCWVWIIDRDDKHMTPQVWDMSWAQDRDIAAMSHFKSGKVLLIDHPDDGYDVIVKKTGTGKKNTRYTITIDRDSSPISDDDEKQEEILNFIQENPIPTVINYFSADHIAKKLEGTTEEKDRDLDDDEDEDKPRKRQAGKRSRDDDDEEEAPRKKKKPAEDDDDDEDDKPRKKKKPADDDDDEEETPRRRRKIEDDDDDEDDKPKKKKRPADDDDDDDEDERPKKKKRPADDDDDEDERPKKKKRPADDDDDDEDDKPAKKKKRPAEDDDDDEDERPRKKKKPADDDDD